MRERQCFNNAPARFRVRVLEGKIIRSEVENREFVSALLGWFSHSSLELLDFCKEKTNKILFKLLRLATVNSDC